jgi:hypothetical protein
MIIWVKIHCYRPTYVQKQINTDIVSGGGYRAEVGCIGDIWKILALSVSKVATVAQYYSKIRSSVVTALIRRVVDNAKQDRKNISSRKIPHSHITE